MKQIKATLKKYDSVCLISEGRDFHSFGAIEEKALSPIDLRRVGRTVKAPPASEEQRSRVGM